MMITDDTKTRYYKLIQIVIGFGGTLCSDQYPVGYDGVPITVVLVALGQEVAKKWEQIPKKSRLDGLGLRTSLWFGWIPMI